MRVFVSILIVQLGRDLVQLFPRGREFLRIKSGCLKVILVIEHHPGICIERQCVRFTLIQYRIPKFREESILHLISFDVFGEIDRLLLAGTLLHRVDVIHHDVWWITRTDCGKFFGENIGEWIIAVLHKNFIL
ncbi:hypothetical protein D3C72_1011390 [compost metagenome]